MKFTLLASSILAAACALASPIIEARDKHLISYSFKDGQAFLDIDQEVRRIIKQATGTEYWVCNRAFPPTCYPPPLETDDIEKLEALEGVVVQIIVRE
ncbi:hypothetical protein VFPFJ_10830 [Purpureocillium lilacinum]|uniref:Uncharacterized protein n=1 Tax=Purpureocillium lilacinum TaxID=33203 RepID=A0A179GRK5_PURLI|nr:hypothetical protein VFPFJ_10830 [Purpureocillium lilacinum]KAK4090482.1 hypothetical protein Purlil1_5154 [Purpureocillium lilacinum]OAQ75840.1 hypothetical protein VFPFJ_10830 [Purpureocillium lilacinum]OAQ80504.1 hypothetical protein VFPBJ_06089 [Purpureocillium lilacinum]PWI70752.1 hypothetical protein PCL_12120 [Purpureocillium lilacinum]GJN75017.1 hypothetical protein PLICBS_009113 [Purpureocillium lilacinum]